VLTKMQVFLGCHTVLTGTYLPELRALCLFGLEEKCTKILRNVDNY